MENKNEKPTKKTLKKGSDPLDKEFKALYSNLLQTVGKDTEKLVKEKEIQEVIEKLWNLIKAKFLQICRKPVYSRGIQSILKWGSNIYKRAIFEKMKNYLVELSIDSHSSKMVEKMYNYGSPEIRKAIRDELLGKFDQLGYSKYGSKVFGHVFSEKRNPSESWESIKNEILFRILSTKLAQFYTTTGGDSKSKSRSFVAFFSNLEHQSAKTSVLENSVVTIQKFVDGELLDRPFVHLLIWNYIKCCIAFYQSEDEEHQKVYEVVTKNTSISTQYPSLEKISQKGKSCLASLLDQILEGSYSLLSTREGVDSLVVLLGFAKAQQRKKVLKNIKKDIMDLAMNPVDYILLLRLISTTDDTKILNEIIWNSLVSEGELNKRILMNSFSVKLITYLLVPQVSLRNFTQYEYWALSLESFTSLKSTQVRIQEMNKICIPALENLLFNSQDQESILENLILSVTGKELILALIQYYLDNHEMSDQKYHNKALELINHSLSRLISNNYHLLKDNTGHRAFVSVLKLINEQPPNISSEFDPFRNTIVIIFEKSLLEMLSSRAVFILVEMIGQNFQQKDFKSCTMWRVRVKELIKDVIQDCISNLKESNNNTTGVELVAKYTNLSINIKNTSFVENVNNNKKPNKKQKTGQTPDSLEYSSSLKHNKRIHL
ncbi:penguin containing pumolio repeats [Cryptosporidium sp. chipmunk genotype I]|uniref:penguin containing pumolio repeats n=1 Tax=Cryptosporidium sp. chipmunk genotype I TaxID=1280935 RepID=UPI00351A11D4|nr:penguin containing pumolio repeats [Cryptosporidium sp. chipmunk genotype I]